MSAVEDGADLQSDAIGNNKRHPNSSLGLTSSHVSRTLLDVIRDEEPHASLFGHKDKKSWKAFRDRLRLRRAGAAWTSSIHIPTSDVPIRNVTNIVHSVGHRQSLISKRNSVRFTTVSSLNPDDPHENQSSSSRPVMTRRSSTRYAIEDPSEAHDGGELPHSRSMNPKFARHNSTRFPAGIDTGEEEAERGASRKLGASLAEERALSAREAVAAQEAAEAEVARAAAMEAEEEDEDEEVAPEPPEVQMRMSLMDLLEETDREMGLEGAKYSMVESSGVEEEGEEEEGAGRVEHTCCVCMVRHKGSAFIPCGHTFCRLCSRELWVQRGNCPLCNGFIVEILDIF